MKHIKAYKLFEAYSKRPIISYDFDGVLHKSVKGLDPINFSGYQTWEPFTEMHDKMREDAKTHDIVVVTARSPKVSGPTKKFIDLYDLPVSNIYYTDNLPKLSILKEIGAIKHYDDNPKMVKELRGSGIEFELINPK